MFSVQISFLRLALLWNLDDVDANGNDDEVGDDDGDNDNDNDDNEDDNDDDDDDDDDDNDDDNNDYDDDVGDETQRSWQKLVILTKLKNVLEVKSYRFSWQLEAEVVTCSKKLRKIPIQNSGTKFPPVKPFSKMNPTLCFSTCFLIC